MDKSEAFSGIYNKGKGFYWEKTKSPFPGRAEDFIKSSHSARKKKFILGVIIQGVTMPLFGEDSYTTGLKAGQRLANISSLSLDGIGLEVERLGRSGSNHLGELCNPAAAKVALGTAIGIRIAGYKPVNEISDEIERLNRSGPNHLGVLCNSEVAKIAYGTAVGIVIAKDRNPDEISHEVERLRISGSVRLGVLCDMHVATIAFGTALGINLAHHFTTDQIPNQVASMSRSSPNHSGLLGDAETAKIALGAARYLRDVTTGKTGRG
jgi:hypothetical protein